MALSTLLHPVGFENLTGWQEDHHAKAFNAFRRSSIYLQDQTYNEGRLGIDLASLAPAHSAAINAGDLLDEQARQFFEEFFTPCHIVTSTKGTGLVTGFYEPIVQASRSRTQRFSHPIYARPCDLVKIDKHNRDASLPPKMRMGRQDGNSVVPYYDRQTIDEGALEGQNLELAWLESRVDVFFIHVQGAARLEFEGGGAMRITYDGQNGMPFSGIGSYLVTRGEISASQISMQSIRKWLAEHGDLTNEVLWRNRSYIFFREAEVSDMNLGPIAAAKVPLTPGRSMAVDRLQHTFSTPIFVDAPDLRNFEREPFHRLMIAQETGSAIIGAARGDLFAGSGHNAGEIAGNIKHEARFFAFVPNALVADNDAFLALTP